MIRRLFLAFALSLGMCATPMPAPAAVLPTTPATIAVTLASYTAGDIIQPGAGAYGTLYLRGKTAITKPVTIACLPGAVFSSIRLDGASGVTITNCAFDGGGVQDFGLNFVGGDHNTVALSTFANYLRAAVELNSDDSALRGNQVVRSGSDGFDIALSHRVVVDGNICADFTPTPLAHPDCIQLWSRPTAAPTADVSITNNRVLGNMQGISLFNHLRADATGKLVDDGGFDRIDITGNDIAVSDPDALDAYECRNCIIGGAGALANRVTTLAGSARLAHLYADPVSAAGVAANDVGTR